MTKSNLILIAILILIFLRFLNLGSIPIFGDEALYLSLTDEFQSNINTISKSVSFGVFPVTIWLLTIIQVITGDFFNPLLLGRFFSALSDVITGLFIFLLGRQLVNKTFGIFALIIYLSLPLNFFHSRFILLDSLANMFSVIAVYISSLSLSWRKINQLHIKWILCVTTFIILAFFTKPIAVVSLSGIILIPLSVFLFKIKSLKKAEILYILLNYLILLLLSFFLILLFYIPVRNEFNGRYIADVNQASSAWTSFKSNLWKTYWWSRSYLPLTILISTFFSIIYIFIKKEYKLFGIIVWLAVIIFLECLLSARFFPRHIFPLAAPVSLIVGYFFFQFYKRFNYFSLIVLILMLSPALLFIKQLLLTPAEARIALEDRQQIYEDWTSGAGIQETVDMLNSLSSEESVVFIDDSSISWTIEKLYPVKANQILISKNLAQGKFLSNDEFSIINNNQNNFIIVNKFFSDTSIWPVENIYSYSKGPNREIKLYLIKSVK